MKILFTLLLCLAAGWVRAQAADSAPLPTDPDTHRITYTEIVQMPGLSQAELYTRAKLWFADTFKSAKNVIYADEKDAGVVQGEGGTSMEVHLLGKNMEVRNCILLYTVKLAAREGRYRYEITDFNCQILPSLNYPALVPPISMEEMLASWRKPASKNGKNTKFDVVTSELNKSVVGTSTGLAASIKSGMARTPGGPASGKTW